MGGVGLVFALVAATVAPALALASSAVSEVGAGGATLALVRPGDGGAVTLGLATADGSNVDPAKTVLTVPGPDAIVATLDAAAYPADGGFVQVTWDKVTLPGGVAAGSSAEKGPQIVVTATDSGKSLLGSATDAPTAAEIPNGGKVPTQWKFTAPGDYTVTAIASLLDGHRSVTKRGEPVTYTFKVADPAAVLAPVVDPTPVPSPVSDPAPVPSPAPEPGTDTAPTPAPEGPLPDGQSDQAAPGSKKKRIIGAVHTDAVSAYLDKGKLVLETKADMDVNGDGTIDLGTRLTTSESLFHLSDDGKMKVPDSPAYSFLGEKDAIIWIAPQTQNHSIIWPGFSTEDPNLKDKVQGDALKVRLVKTQGPGNAEVFMQDGIGVKRIFSSTTKLPDWSISIPQHTHMNWAFTKAGTYTFTFEMSGVVDGRPQTASNDYTFVVGDIAAHTQATTTTLAAAKTEVDPGKSVMLTATVEPKAVGAVQFRDSTTNVLLGHTPVKDGVAVFRADALPSGPHEIVAQFVPTWSNDFAPSSSKSVKVTVRGEFKPKPGHDDTTPVPASEVAAQPSGTTVAITTADKKMPLGGSLTVKLKDKALAGTWVSVWVPGQNPAWRGWTQADLHAAFTVQAPSDIKLGKHQLVIKNAAGAFVGWDEFTVTQKEAGTTPIPTPTPVPQPTPTAPAQSCTPAVVLDHGHIDSFNVSAGNGKIVLQLKEDVTGHQVIREAETVLLRVKESAFRSNIPASYPGAPAGYVLPLTQDPDLIWPGWDTNRTSASGYTDVSINITNVAGPGIVYMYTEEGFGSLKSLLGGGYTLPGTIREKDPAHTHAQWVFSQKGIYKLTVHAVATNPSNGQSLRSATHTYVFQVGDVPLGDAFCGLHVTGADDAQEVNAAIKQADADAIAAAAAANSLAQQGSITGKPVNATATSANGGSLLNQFANPMVVAGIIVGGLLIVLGIVGGTVWYLRRLSVAVAPVQVSGS